MRAAIRLLISTLCVVGTACGDAATPRTSTSPAPAPQAAAAISPATPALPPGGKVQRIGVWQPPAGLEQVPIWPGDAPDMADVPWPAESVLTADTPEALARIIAERKLDPARWTLLQPDPADLRGLAGLLGIRYRSLADGEFNHSSALVLLDAQGRIAARTETIGTTDAAFIAAIDATLAATE